jgi:hypothetical protein
MNPDSAAPSPADQGPACSATVTLPDGRTAKILIPIDAGGGAAVEPVIASVFAHLREIADGADAHPHDVIVGACIALGLFAQASADPSGSLACLDRTAAAVAGAPPRKPRSPAK